MNSKINSIKGVFAQSLLALLVAAPTVMTTPYVANAAGSNSAPNTVRQTNYPIPSDAYFVAPNGKDTNTGSITSPWSVEKAFFSAPSGSTIVFRGGQYRVGGLKPRNRFILQAYPNERPWFKGSIVVSNWAAEGNIWRHDGWNYSFPPNMGSEYIDPLYPMAGYRDMVFINGAPMKQVGSKEEVAPGTFYVDDVNKRLYIGSDPAGKMVEATTQNEAFTLARGSRSDASGTVVRGLGFTHYADRGLFAVVPRVTLENNTFISNGLEGAKFGGENGASRDAVVRGNNFSFNGIKGLGVNAAHRILIENNTFKTNNVERFTTIWDAAGAKLTRTHAPILRNNLAEDNLSNGLWVDESSTSATIVNNRTRKNQGYGIFFEISHKAIIAGNIVYNNLGGILSANSTSVRIFNNTMANNGWNLNIKDTPRNNTNSEEINQGITWIARNHEVRNNILSNGVDSTMYEASNCNTREPSSLMIGASNSNAYYRSSTTRPRYVFTWSIGGRQCVLRYNTLAAFRAAHSNYESRSIEISNVSTNPFFVNAAAGDFRLKSDSPAIGRGEALPADIAEAMGLQPGRAVDLGALQSQVFLD